MFYIFVHMLNIILFMLNIFQIYVDFFSKYLLNIIENTS